MQLFKTPCLTILVQCFDERGVMRFPTDQNAYFGLNMTIDQTLAPSKQAQAFVADFLGRPELESQLEPLATVEPVLESEGSAPSLLYLMRLHGQHNEVSVGWPTLASLLRSLPQGRIRVAYNKALQYFAGAADDGIDILELDAEVRERLVRLLGEKGSPLSE